jgi:hypothetical protein
MDVLRSVGMALDSQVFYLAGGTALSLYYGHRRSIDLDWFSIETIDDPMLLAQQLRDTGVAFQTESISKGTLHGLIQQVRTSFFEYRYPLLQPLIFLEECNCSLASLDDVACMKLVAISQRGSKKDFIDIYQLLQHHKPLDQLLDCYQKKYQTDNILSVLVGMVYYDDADFEPDPPLWSIDWQLIKKDLKRIVKQFE